MLNIIRTRVYTRKAGKLLSDVELLEAENAIAQAPQRWPMVAGTGGIRKARAARGNAGKSGGVRIMYYYWSQEGALYLLDIYAKNEKENLSAADKKLLKALMETITGTTS